MEKKITIAIDAMGGDNSPDKTVQGIGFFLKKHSKNNDFFLNIYGDEKIINDKLNKFKISSKFFKIIHTDSVVSDNQTPLTAIKNSKNTSMWNSIKSQINGESDISLSAGNTGVLLVVSKMILKMMDKVSKPALAGLWPSKKNLNVVLDLGANIECDEKNLVDFAELGSALYKSLFPKTKPILSLLNVGSEEIKGTEVLKKTFKNLKELNHKNNFIFKGYCEGNTIMSGDSHVIVTDGFTGNIALKTAEGTAKFITDNLKKSLMQNIFTKFSLIFSYFSLKEFKNKLDPRKYNGAIFLGLNGPVVKSHGGTDALGFYYSIDLCYRIVKGDLMKQVKNNLNHLNVD
ncbi:phosphate acyltransferase PlsX [Pelagibacteraceae bacterium]|jgi:phosphate acyltransferase|nr:phosphate acyltransferase PlsX [Pelagibacteraceae bacterium]